MIIAIVGPRPLDGRGVLLTLGGWGGAGHVLTFMWTCRWSTCYALAAGRCMYSWVGWGGLGRGMYFNVHVNLQMKYMLCFGCRQVHVFMGGLGRGIFKRSCELADEGHAMLWLPAGACIHGWAGVGWGGACILRSCVMLRYCMFSWTLHSCIMLRYCMFSWTLHSFVMLRYCMFSWTLR